MTKEANPALASDDKPREIHRKRLHVDNRPQLALFAPEPISDSAGSEREAKPAEVRQYEDPSPEGILIGREDLRSFLRNRGEKTAFGIRKLVRSLELKAFHQASPKAGRRPYHPAGMLGLILFGILEGRSSLRQLEVLARSDVRSWWISGGIHPDHSVIGRFIQRHQKALSEEFFVELTRQILSWSKSKGGDLSGDGTLIQAAGSRYRKLTLEAAEKAEKEALESQKENPEDEQFCRQARQATAVAEAARDREKRNREHRSKGKVLVSPSEPDSYIQPLKNKAGTAPSYKPVVFSNSDQIIVSQTVHPSCEHAEYSYLLDQAEASSGEVSRIRLDSGYFVFPVIEESATREIELLCPEGKGGKPKKSKLYPKSEFRYDSEGDYFECPAGQHLVAMRKKKGKDRGREYLSYGKADCRACELRDQCTTSRKGRTIKRYMGDELKEQVRVHMQEESNQDEYKKRSGMVEPVFARIKQHQGLRRFGRMGLANVRVEFAFHAVVHNIIRWMALDPSFLRIFSTRKGLFSHHWGLVRTQRWRIKLIPIFIEFNPTKRLEKFNRNLCCEF